jgi:hypothetical protein
MQMKPTNAYKHFKEYYIILYYIVCIVRLLHVHVSTSLVAILKEVSTKDILQKLQEPM